MDGLDWGLATKEICAAAAFLKKEGSKKARFNGKKCLLVGTHSSHPARAGGHHRLLHGRGAEARHAAALSALTSLLTFVPSQQSDRRRVVPRYRVRRALLWRAAECVVWPNRERELSRSGPLFYSRLTQTGITVDCANVKKPVLAQFGSLDDNKGFSDPAAAKKLEEALKAGGAEHEVVIYDGVGHAFMNDSPMPFKTFAEREKAQPGVVPYNKEVGDKAWDRLTAFLKKHTA